MTAPITAADRLSDFVCARRPAGIGADVRHDVKRLLLNQLKAAAEAAQHPAGAALLAQAAQRGQGAGVRAASPVWWSSAQLPAPQATALHRRLLGLLDFGDTHLPSLGRFTADLLPPVLAQAQALRADGQQLLEALAVGLEVAIACAPLWPETFDASGAAAGEIGVTAACCVLRHLDHRATVAALVDAEPRLSGLPEAGRDTLDGIGEHWRLREIALHCRPLPVHALAPVDAVLALRPLAAGRELARLQIELSPRAWHLARDERASGTRPDLRHGVAGAWLLGQFGSTECMAPCLAHPAVEALRSRIELRLDATLAGLEACSVAAHFTDGAQRHVHVDAFLGSRAQPLSDSQLSEIFRQSAEDLVLPARAGEILHALWGLDGAPDVRALLALLRRGR